MSKKLFILIITFIVLVIGFFGWRYMAAPAKAPSVPVSDSSGTNLFPFGQGASNPSQAKPTTGNDSRGVTVDLSTPSAAPKFRRLSIDPSVGGSFAQIGTTSEVIRFVDRATGHIIQSAVDSNVQTQLSNVTIPQIREVLWGKDSSTLIYRYLKNDSTLQSFYASIRPNAASSSQPIEGIFLPTNIRSLTVSGDKILYFDPAAETGKLIQANMDGSKKTIVWNSSFNDWSISSNGPAKAFVFTRPSGTAKGTGYVIDTAKGTSAKVIGDTFGLEGTISPGGDYVFLSAGENLGISSATYSTAKKTLTQLGLNTLATKCAWSNTDKKIIYCGVPTNTASGTYPDDWYKGEVSFSDRLWKINMETGETTVLLDPSTEMSYDMINLVVDPKDKYISFVNKNDLTIWLLAL